MFVVDRIEGDFAVIEFGDSFIDVPLSSFKEEVKEGDVLNLVVDKEETEKRMNKASQLLQHLFSKSEE